MTEFKVISTKSAKVFEEELNGAMKAGYQVVVLTVKNLPIAELEPFTAVLSRQVPDPSPSGPPYSN